MAKNNNDNITKLIKEQKYRKLQEIVTTTKLPEKTILKLLKTKKQNIYLAIARNNCFSQDIFTYLAIYGNHHVQKDLFKYNTPTNETILKLLKNNVNYIELLQNFSNLNNEILWEIINNLERIYNPSNKSVDILKENQEKLTSEMLTCLYKKYDDNENNDINEYYRNNKLLYFLLEHEKTPSIAIFDFIKSPYSDVREIASKHPNFNMEKYLEEFSAPPEIKNSDTALFEELLETLEKFNDNLWNFK